jgi:hypothetical protein
MFCLSSFFFFYIFMYFRMVGCVCMLLSSSLCGVVVDVMCAAGHTSCHAAGCSCVDVVDVFVRVFCCFGRLLSHCGCNLI